MKEKIKKFLKNNYKLIIFIICILAFFILSQMIFEEEIIQIDNNIYNFISNNVISESFTPIVIFITNLGGGIFLTCLAIILWILIKNKKIGDGKIMKKWIITILVIIILIAILVTAYVLSQNNSGAEENNSNITSSNIETSSNTEITNCILLSRKL